MEIAMSPRGVRVGDGICFDGKEYAYRLIAKQEGRAEASIIRQLSFRSLIDKCFFLGYIGMGKERLSCEKRRPTAPVQVQFR